MTTEPQRLPSASLGSVLGSRVYSATLGFKKKKFWCSEGLVFKMPTALSPWLFSVYLRHGFREPRMALNCSSRTYISSMGRLLSWNSLPPTIFRIPRQGLLGSVGLLLPPGTSSPSGCWSSSGPCLPSQPLQNTAPASPSNV